MADVGCGGGVALLEMARAFPESHFHGFEISLHALERATQNRREAGVENVTFHDARRNPLPDDGRYAFVTTFDCLHDMTDPQGVIHAIRRAIRSDGLWFIAEMKAHSTLDENLERNPMAAMMYGVSVLSCMSSALSEPGGAGLGTLGLPASKAEEMARTAGFTRFAEMPVQHPMNAFYEVRP